VGEAHTDRYRRWLIEQHLPAAAEVPGLSGPHVSFEACLIPGDFRTYFPTPRFSTLYQFEAGLDVAEVLGSPAFREWWFESVRTWLPWVSSQNWVVAVQRFGPATDNDRYDRILMTQVDLAPTHASDWGPWYDHRHVRTSLAIEGLFRPELKRYEAVRVDLPSFQASAVPRFTHVMPIVQDADLPSLIRTRPFAASASDTLVIWRGAMSVACSTMCDKVSVA
jgi:hypothetical protein